MIAALKFWREILIVALVLLAGLQSQRLDRARLDLERHVAAVAAAESTSAQRGATTGQEAITRHVESIAEAAPVVERVVTRVLRQCATADRLPVPEGAAPAAAAASSAGDAEARAFADAIGRDLEACSAELSKLSELQRWVIHNGG